MPVYAIFQGGVISGLTIGIKVYIAVIIKDDAADFQSATGKLFGGRKD